MSDYTMQTIVAHEHWRNKDPGDLVRPGRRAAGAKLWYIAFVAKYASGINAVYERTLSCDQECIIAVNEWRPNSECSRGGRHRKQQSVEAWVIALAKSLKEDRKVPEEFLTALGFNKVQEFSMEKAALKYIRKRLSGTVCARADPKLGWQPNKGWERRSSGDLSVQFFDEEAARKVKEEELKKVRKQIEADEKRSKNRFSESDEDFAARRKRKMRLKKQQKQLSQGGESV